MPQSQAEANAFMQALASKLKAGLPPPEPPRNPDAARHAINVISVFAGLANKMVTTHPSLKPSRQHVERLLEAGRLSSAAVPYRCAECLELYRHDPPGTTPKLCAQCAKAAQRQT